MKSEKKFKFLHKIIIRNAKKKKQNQPICLFSVSLFCRSRDAENSSELIMRKDILFPLL